MLRLRLTDIAQLDDEGQVADGHLAVLAGEAGEAHQAVGLMVERGRLSWGE